MNESKRYYRRHLPHHQPEGAMFHVVFRLKGSLPAEAVERLRAEREQAEKQLATQSSEKDKRQLVQKLRWADFTQFNPSNATQLGKQMLFSRDRAPSGKMKATIM